MENSSWKFFWGMKKILFEKFRRNFEEIFIKISALLEKTLRKFWEICNFVVYFHYPFAQSLDYFVSEICWNSFSGGYYTFILNIFNCALVNILVYAMDFVWRFFNMFSLTNKYLRFRPKNRFLGSRNSIS